MITTAATEPASASSEPIERSISPAIITTVRPAAMIPTFDACSRMLKMFDCREEVLGLEREVEPDARERDEDPDDAERPGELIARARGADSRARQPVAGAAAEFPAAASPGPTSDTCRTSPASASR